MDVGRYTGPCDPEAPANSKEWDACDVRAYYEAIKNLNIAGIFYGHTHTRDVFQWDGQSKLATTGIRVFNTDNAAISVEWLKPSSTSNSMKSNWLYAKYMTRDGWQTGSFTPQVWRSPVCLKPYTILPTYFHHILNTLATSTPTSPSSLPPIVFEKAQRDRCNTTDGFLQRCSSSF